MHQTIHPERAIFYAGDTITFTLDGLEGRAGRAILRSTIGRAEVRRRELIEHNEKGTPILGLDWHDLEMTPVSDGKFALTLPLTEVGVFEAKCCFIPADHPGIDWPEGGNFRIKVEASTGVCGNTMYSAFVRQFGENCARAVSKPLPGAVEKLDAEQYTVIPPSGTFRQLAAKLDHIFDDLGCRILQLLPIHPVPTQYGRMGRYGSPFAALDYFSIDSALADFDPKATPMEQFEELVEQVHARGGRIFMDIPVNHTGWASKLQMEHPGYFVREPDGAFVSPGAWGVTWADLCKLNYREPMVHRLMAKVFLFWCRRRVDGFRCDAGYMLPAEAWEYIVPKIRSEYPDTVFLLEGLGGPLKVQEDLLGRAGLNWGYSELFQNYTRDEIARYFPYVDKCSQGCGTLVNFAETHDNSRLAASGPVYAKLRFMVAAMLAEDGAFGFANGAEFFATEKIDVHGNSALNWGSEPNLVGLIGKLNTLLADHPAFHTYAKVELIQEGEGNVLAVRRTAPDGNLILALLNLDCDRPAVIGWESGLTPGSGTELLTGEAVKFSRDGRRFTLELEPGGARCIGFDSYRIAERSGTGEPARSLRQRADAAAMAVQVRLGGKLTAGKAGAGRELLADPEGFCAAAAGNVIAPVTHYRVRYDAKRQVMIPPGDVLLVESPRKFHLAIFEAGRAVFTGISLPTEDGRNIVPAILPENATPHARELEISVRCFGTDCAVKRTEGYLLLLPPGERRRIRVMNSAAEIRAGESIAFAANHLGGMSFFRAAWGVTASKYEAVLAGNVNPDYPVDRRVMFTRLRGWLLANGYSQPLDLRSIQSFSAMPDNRARWLFSIPVGQGCRVRLEVDFEGAERGDAARFRFRRPLSSGEEDAGEIDDETPVKLILRPDLEDRVNHELTKAFTGPETRFPEAVRETGRGFEFTPADRTLEIRLENGVFRREPEWYYLIDLPAERDYGLEDKTDLFSPGYVEMELTGGGSSELFAEIRAAGTAPESAKFPVPAHGGAPLPAVVPPDELFVPAMRRYIVKRERENTVIAGYPWFLDWGRDTLIALRGLIGSEFEEEAAAIIRQFACFEREGTIPNVIRGNDDRNRDTSDAPLYLVVAARDYADRHSTRILDTNCSGRKLRDVLRSIVGHYRSGTPNGIVMDPDSGLVFSPSHFSWMDTNHPAATPREGYPIEIQALWYAALEFLGREEPEYQALAERVSTGIEELFFRSPNGPLFCSDCLHAAPGVSARDAVPDDHNRPNQLLAVTLGAVKDPAKRQAILGSAEELLVPGGIRSLASRPVSYLLPVRRNGEQLNDPANPYQGVYRGPEDTARKVAYHNGTVWCWPFPAYCEALYLIGGEPVRKRALALLMSSAHYFESGVPGQLPEVADGDYPHKPGGCAAQAWSVSEFFRVYRMLKQ